MKVVLKGLKGLALKESKGLMMPVTKELKGLVLKEL